MAGTLKIANPFALGSRSLIVDGGGTLYIGGAAANLSTSLDIQNLNLAAGSNFNIDLADNVTSQIVAWGSVTLGSDFLNIAGRTAAPQAGGAIVLIRNEGGNAVSGIFLNQPEGSYVVANGQGYQITYRYGSSGI